MGRKRCRRKQRHECTPVFIAAFGAGLFLALFCSLKLVLFFAAIALIYLGITMRSC